MKRTEKEWDHPELQPFERSFMRGEHLFRQGEPGTTFFIVRRGVVKLTAEREGQELMVSLMDAGQVLGEKCLFTEKPYKRFFGAQAETEVVALELRAADMAVIERKAPELANAILKLVCRVSIDRLDRIDHMVKVLRSSDNVERLVYLIVHFAFFEGHSTPIGHEVILPLQTVRYYIAMSPFEIEECLAELHKRGIFLSEGDDRYVLTNQNALIESIPQLRDALPAIRPI